MYYIIYIHYILYILLYIYIYIYICFKNFIYCGFFGSQVVTRGTEFECLRKVSP